ncbi:hypothetical protein [Phytohabitans houttuyneae]|uniref:Uncharacterized protein n=1 Tax=Phytohabitans houttuyneae TaxID=1076126 RepID=A0A6V8K2V5_9ACTN|nr:hypothetical protein [Phytohabitans houttuyneae]GFJ79472.1 hypothetical protein Phou_036520 [Phytohabitans houttuyneae]
MTLTWSVGQRITAARLNLRNPVEASKPGDTSRASTTTSTADPDLVLVLKANTTYNLMGQAYTTGGDNAGDFKYAWSWTNTGTVLMGAVGPHNSIASGSQGDAEWVFRAADSASPSTDTPYATSAGGVSVRINDRIIVGPADVTLTLIWAQQNSNATATVLKAGSWVTATPVA